MREARSRRGSFAGLAALALFGALGPLAPGAHAIGCSADELTAAILDANADPAPTTIDLASGCAYTYSTPYSTSGPYTSWYGPSALPAIASPVTIEGNGATIERSSLATVPFRLLFVGADTGDADTSNYASPGPGALTLRNLTLRGGLAEGGSSETGGGGAGMGGAIFSQGDVTLEGVTVTENSAQGGSIDLALNVTTGAGIGSDAVVGTGGGFGSGFAGGVGGLGAAGANSDGGGGGGFRSGDNGIGSAGGGPETGLGNTGGWITGFGLGGNGSGGGGGGAGPAVAGSGGSFGSGGTSSSDGGGGGGGGGAGGGGVGGGGGAGTSAGGSGGFGGGGGQGGASGGNGGFGGGGASGGLGAGTGGFGGGNGIPGRGGGGAGMGGAIFNHQGELNVANSTLSGNSANGGTGTGANFGLGLGGAVFNLNGAVNLDSVTIASNTVTPNQGFQGPEGGALYTLGYMGDDTGDPADHDYLARAVAVNSILADSGGVPEVVANAPTNVAGGAPATVTGGGPNTVDDAGDTDVNVSAINLVESYVPSGSGTITGTPSVLDPLLGPLADNNGPTQTHAITALSPAFNTGATALASDQRGVARPQGDADDIGAFELEVAGPGADLGIVKTASPGPVTVGQDITYTLSVTNGGPSEATNVVATDVLPAGVAFKSAGSGCANFAGTVLCDFGAVANGATETAQIVVTAQAPGAIANTATVVGAEPDPVPANDSSTAATTVTGAANPAPVIQRASLTRRKFRLGRRAPSIAQGRRPKVGTVIRLTLSEAASVELSFARLRKGKRAVKVRRKVKLNAAEGANRIRFQGRLTRRVALKPGRYRMTLGRGLGRPALGAQAPEVPPSAPLTSAYTADPPADVAQLARAPLS